MKLSLNVNYSKLPADIKSPDVLTRFLITEVIARRWPQGVPRTESRIYGKVLDQFYEEKPEIEIEEAAFNLIKESLDQSVLPAHLSSWKWALLEHLENFAKKK